MKQSNKHDEEVPIYLRIKASSHNHSAEVSESVLTTNNEKGLVKIRMIFPQFFFLNFPFKNEIRTCKMEDSNDPQDLLCFKLL